ncbi:MAG: hypothetical protein U0556_06990 [Dehalococcoidia bacterium]
MTVVEQKAKALAHTFEDTFVYGDTSVSNARSTGCKLTPAGQQIHQGSGTSAGGALVGKYGFAAGP